MIQMVPLVQKRFKNNYDKNVKEPTENMGVLDRDGRISGDGN